MTTTLHKPLHGRLFLDHILAQMSDPQDPYSSLRAQARARLAELGIPTPRDEDWKYSDLSSLLAHDFQLSKESQLGSLPPSDVEPYVWPESRRSCVVFVNGYFAPQLSDLSALPEALQVRSLAQADAGWVTGQLQTIATEDSFTALNTAHLGDVACIQVPKNLRGVPPLQVLYLTLVSDVQPILAQPRCLLSLEAHSQLTVIEDHVSLGPGIPFSNAVTEINLADNARLHHVILQRQGSSALQISKTAVRQSRDSHYQQHALQWGSLFSRHNLEITQIGSQAHTDLKGLTLLRGSQHSDTHSRLVHQAPHGSSRQLHKCIVDETAHAVFSGRVLVCQAAQLTDAAQSNRNLLLSPKARVDTQPQLEIFADNVKCAHGATVSQLETEEIFYLQSRGIGQAQARQLLTYAFAAEVLAGIPLATLSPSLPQLSVPEGGAISRNRLYPQELLDLAG
ncbi:Fe-S cluster assembly protein SufD [Synechococcus sp. Nb3U1]|uniref:Fe-S cluster assembly protein SufD n=1 Tax=Synechococcus sp. Nb3U1 TaxID=1914529 RepID=UPI001F1ED48B|nr:Fe-S cluster assembly protein SufD [Synechococcus sp. Nb3U1]MCF2972461.1 Fe-S cluster assembly protein SufD [Synechococcus sp. Nb3U1]